jgi:hypothetical protein
MEVSLIFTNEERREEEGRVRGREMEDTPCRYDSGRRAVLVIEYCAIACVLFMNRLVTFIADFVCQKVSSRWKKCQ